MNSKDSFSVWLKEAKDVQIAKELRALKKLPQEIHDRFSSSLCFGTGGLRGEMGAGTNRMNIYTVKRISKAVAKWSKQRSGKKVVISYDSRKNSLLFAKTSAEVFAAEGFIVFLTCDIMPTPFLSFAVRFLDCDLGVMITASHNPPKYNGYKVYSSKGCQLVDDETKQIAGILADEPYFDYKSQSVCVQGQTCDDKVCSLQPNAKQTMLTACSETEPEGTSNQKKDFENLVMENQIRYVEDDVINKYLENVLQLKKCEISSITAAYSALNGAGYKLLPQLLRRAGIKKLFEVKQQCFPDENFSTCKEPNPEKPAAFDLAVKCANENRCDIAIITDPDADRIGIAVREENGGCVVLDGNQTALLILDFLLTHFQKSNPIVITTMVSGPLILDIAKKHNAKIILTPTGFKYIGKKMEELEDQLNLENFLCGLEESHGYLAGSFVRDKDALISAYLLCQAAATLKAKNKTMLTRLNEIYSEFGFIKHGLFTYRFEKEEGQAEMYSCIAKLENFCHDIFSSVGRVNRLTNYKTNPLEGFSPFEALKFSLDIGAEIIIRPSGTEPMLKVYVSVKDSKIQAEKKAEKIKNILDNFFR